MRFSLLALGAVAAAAAPLEKGQGSGDLAKSSNMASKVACVLGADNKDSKKIKDCLGDEDLEKVCKYTDLIPLDILETVCKLKS